MNCDLIEEIYYNLFFLLQLFNENKPNEFYHNHHIQTKYINITLLLSIVRLVVNCIETIIIFYTFKYLI